MLKKAHIIIFLSLLFVQKIIAQETYHTQPLADDIKTVHFSVNDNAFSPPIITLNSSDILTLNFDRLTIDNPRLRYRLVHCSADWKKDNLLEIEYFRGFNDQLIENYHFSENTTVNYIHYSINFPNINMQPKISGNYAVEVYPESHPERPILRACFSIVEPLVSLHSEVTGNTDTDINKAHQQLSFEINYSQLPLCDPMTEIIANIRQNNRIDNQRLNVKPSFIYPDRMIFTHQRELIFDAGNEYRRFEITGSQSGGMNVKDIQYENPYFQAILHTDESRADKTWQYDEDQDGRFFIQNKYSLNKDIRADYFVVHFIFSPPLFSNKKTEQYFLNGYFTYNNTRDFQLHYDEDSKTFQLPVLLKQGSYNYQYLTPGTNGFTTEDTEGNYYETENEYLITVYYRMLSSSYDRLVGWQKIKSKNQ